MAFAFADRVREQVTAFSGSGAITLPGVAISGFQTFLSGWGASGTGFYTIAMGAQWEVGFGTLNAGGTTLTRTDPIAGSSGPATLVTFSAGTLDCWGDAPADYLGSRFTEDFVINGNGQVAQIGTGSTADDVYSHDCWYALTQTAALTTATPVDQEDGLPFMWRITQGQAAAQRMGYAQIIESKRCKKLRGKRVTFGGRLRYSNAAALRFAILEWTGTADSVTSDVVNDWTSATFTAGNFFISANLTVRAVGTLTPLAANMADFRLSTVLGSTFNNLIVFVWTEGTAAQNSTLDVACSLKMGFTVHPLVFPDFGHVLRECQRLFHSTYTHGVVPGTSTEANGIGGQGSGTAQRPFITHEFPVAMRVAPTIAYYSTTTGVIGKMRNLNTSLDVDANTYGVPGDSSVTSYPSGTPALGDAVFYHLTASARL